jgi:hypothetical protein
MGALTGSPKSVPLAQPQTIIRYVAEPTATTDSRSSETSTNDAALASEARSDSLLRRTRGRFGTVLTGFRGFLSPQAESSSDDGRKTLLGE